MLTVNKLSCKSHDISLSSGGLAVQIGEKQWMRSDLSPRYSLAGEPATNREFERSIFNRDSSVVSSPSRVVFALKIEARTTGSQKKRSDFRRQVCKLR